MIGPRTRSLGGRCAGPRGALLLESVLALSIFAMAGLVIAGLVGDAADSLSRSRDALRAADLARSAMARLEAGISPMRDLSGPVPRWEEDETAREGDPSEFDGGFADAPPAPSQWEVEIATEPSEFEGLTRVTVRAFKRDASGAVAAAHTLHQLVRLGSAAEDRAGAEDALSGAARRGAERSERRGGADRERARRTGEERP